MADVARARAKSLLARITPDQKSHLYQWLDRHPVSDVLKMVAALPPDGFGLQTHYTTLFRIKNQMRAGFVSHQLQNLGEVCQEIDSSLDISQVQSVLNAMLHERGFQLLERSNDPSEINKLIDAISKLPPSNSNSRNSPASNPNPTSQNITASTSTSSHLRQNHNPPAPSTFPNRSPFLNRLDLRKTSSAIFKSHPRSYDRSMNNINAQETQNMDQGIDLRRPIARARSDGFADSHQKPNQSLKACLLELCQDH